jgi:hypothetical protein
MSAWYELLIEGSEEALQSFLDEHQGAKDWQAVRGSELPLKEESLTARLLGFLGARTHHLVFAPAQSARVLVRGLKKHADLRLEHLREVEDAGFAFEVETFSRPKAQEIRSALHSDLPPGISLVDIRESGEIDPEVEGVELYAPAHAYTYRASGSFHGDLPGILEMHRRLEEMDFCKPGKIEIAAREVEGVGG